MNMKTLNYLKKTIECYEVTDEKTHANFGVVVTEDSRGFSFEIGCRGLFSSDGALKCAELLQHVIARDYSNREVKKDETSTLIKFKKNSKAKLSKLEAAQKRSFSADEGDAA